jgi:hypothetical protein
MPVSDSRFLGQCRTMPRIATLMIARPRWFCPRRRVYAVLKRQALAAGLKPPNHKRVYRRGRAAAVGRSARAPWRSTGSLYGHPRRAVPQYAGQSRPTMKFLAVLIAAIFLSGSALAETTSTPISSRFAAAAKAAKVSSKVKKLAPRVCPRPEDDECRAWCCTCGAKCSGTDCNPRYCP